MHLFRLQKWVLFCRLRSYTCKSGMASSPEVQPELCPQLVGSVSFCLHHSAPEWKRVWLRPGKVQTDVLTLPRRELLWYKAALIYQQCSCCSPYPPPSHPPLPVKPAVAFYHYSYSSSSPGMYHTRLLMPRASYATYPYFLPSNFIVLISWYLSAQLCLTISAVPVLSNLCSCQLYCLLWPVASLESIQRTATRQ